MSALAVKILFSGIILFCTGLFICAAAKNIFKIFIGTILMYNSAILLLGINQNSINEIISFVLSAPAPVICFIGLFVIIKIYKKFNTLDITRIEEIMKEEK